MSSGPEIEVARCSIKTSLIRLLIMLAPTSAYDLDQSTTPDVVTISKVSNMFKVALVLPS